MDQLADELERLAALMAGDPVVAHLLPTAIAALRAREAITVLDCDHVATSFPGFDTLAGQLGLRINTGAR